MSDLERAVALFESGEYTCVLCCGNEVQTDTRSGIRPLMSRIADKTDLKGFSVADKIVGKAAALLFVLCGITAVYAQVISDAGVDVLTQHGIPFSCKTQTNRIINRTGTGSCPMECAVAQIDEPKKAYAALNAAIIKMQDMKKGKIQ